MTEEIINADGSRNWEANILLDNIKRLEQEDFALTQESQQKSQTICDLYQENKELKEKITSLESEIRQKKRTIMMNNDHYLTVDENNRKYRSALEEIKNIITQAVVTNNKKLRAILDKINEVLK